MEESEKQEIIDRAVEKALLMIPEVVGNLMAQNAAYHKINSKFYQDYPEFGNHKNVVTAVVEMIDGQNPGLEYEDILQKAIPEIRKRIGITRGLSTNTISGPGNRQFGNGEM